MVLLSAKFVSQFQIEILFSFFCYVIFLIIGSEANETEGDGICTNGKRQSPIQIDSKTVREINGFLYVQHYDVPTTVLHINDHNITVKNAQNIRIQLTTAENISNESKEFYVFDSLHFHTGCTEHVIDGKSLSAELHMVHYKSVYGSIVNAKKHKDGIVVLGILYQEAGENDKSAICHDLETIMDKNSSSNTISLNDLLPKQWNQYYAYEGSLTTGTCDESVLWAVVKQNPYLCPHQVNNLKEQLHMPCRELQNINGRRIYLVNFPNAGGILKSTISSFVICNILLFLKSLTMI